MVIRHGWKYTMASGFKGQLWPALNAVYSNLLKCHCLCGENVACSSLRWKCIFLPWLNLFDSTLGQCWYNTLAPILAWKFTLSNTVYMVTVILIYIFLTTTLGGVQKHIHRGSSRYRSHGLIRARRCDVLGMLQGRNWRPSATYNLQKPRDDHGGTRKGVNTKLCIVNQTWKTEKATLQHPRSCLLLSRTVRCSPPLGLFWGFDGISGVEQLQRCIK